MASKDSKNNIKPLSDQVVVRGLTDEEAGTKSASGIIIPDSANKEKAEVGIVVAVGPGRWNAAGDKRIPMDVNVGDKVSFSSWKDKEKIGDEEYWIISESDVKAVIG